MSKLTIQDVRDFLGIDFEDAANERVLIGLIGVSEAFLCGALGNSYPQDDERIKALQKFVIADLYDNREMNDKVVGARKRLIDSMLLQLKLEMRSNPQTDDTGGDSGDV